MKRLIITLIFLLGATFITGYCQDLLSVDWHKVVCSDSKIDHVHSICHDKGGNTYTLGSFPGTTNCLGVTFNDSSGTYFLTKQNFNGEKLFAKNLGGTDCFSDGQIQVCKNDDIVLGLCFRDNFFLNGDSITSSVDWSSIILKLDSSLNLIWFKCFPAKSACMINRLVLDEIENIYASILFIDSLVINNNIYVNIRGYGTAITKLNPFGNVLWSHHYYSDYSSINQVIKVEPSYPSYQGKIFLVGNVSGDSIFVDGILMDTQKSKYHSQYFIATMSKDGDILQTNFIDDGIRQVTDISFYQDRIFFAGSFIDTVSWNENQIIPQNYNSLYVGELNHQAEITGFVDLQGSEEILLMDFTISPEYGFVLSGNFRDKLSLQSTSIKLAGIYDLGSFIASFNDTLGLNDFKYVEGGRYNLRRISIYENEIRGTATFEKSCNFANQTCFAYNSDISTFQTTDIEQLPSFSPYQFPSPGLLPLPVYPKEFSVSIFPIPFRETFTMRYSEPVWLTSLTMTNLKGQVISNFEATQDYGFVTYVNCQNLEPGVYTIQYTTSNNFKGSSNIIKID